MKKTQQNELIRYDRLYIGGEWVKPSSDAVIEVRSPHDQSLVGVTAEARPADVDLAVSAAERAFNQGPWPQLSPEERQQIIERFNELYSKHATELATLTTRENGSAIWFTTVLQTMVKEQTAAYLRAAKSYPWEISRPTTAGQKAVIRREPVGVVAAIIPWNAPQQSALVKIIPALLAGCTVVFKPSPETALDGIALGEIFAAAGLPAGVLNIVPAGREVSEYLVSHPRINKIAFTGSTRAGKRIASIAGEQLKRFSLELGGKSAAIILEDADLATTVGSLKFASFANNGESCVAQTRILAPKSRYEEVVNALADMVNSLKVGNPLDPETFIGPIITVAQHDRVNSYIQLGIEEGARIVAGGPGAPEGAGLAGGNYLRPTVFADAHNQMRIAREEIFGPVIVVIPYDGVEEAIRIANDSDYGLSGSIWSTNRENALQVARRIRTGGLSINASMGDFDSPFGGYKNSGIGREFGSAGIDQYVEQKSIVL